MNRLLKCVLSFVLLTAIMNAEAATVKVDGFDYTTSGTTAKVTKGPTSGDVVIPSSFESGGVTYTVTELYNNAFKGSAITSVTVPASVLKIGTSVFNGCKQLKSFSLEDSGAAKANQTIGTSAFENCTALTTLNLPNSVKSISSYCFRGCSSLPSFVCPNGVSMLLIGIFTNCTSLKSFTIGSAITSCDLNSIAEGCPIEEVFVAEGNKNFVAENGVLYGLNSFSGKKNSLAYYPVCRPGDTFTIPDDCPSIENQVFNGAQYLKSIVFNETIDRITNKCFCKCPILESITLGKAISSIGTGNFADSPKLTTLVIPERNENFSFADYTLFDKYKKILILRLASATGTTYTVPQSVVEIGPNALANSTLKTVTLPEGLVTIGGSAFSTCVSLSSINIPQTVRTIDSYAFKGCKQLTGITLPDSLETLGYSAFYNCSKITEITIPEKLTIIDEYTFSGTSLKNVVIPDSVKTIGDGAFEVSTLESVVIGKGVTSIGAEAFYDYYEESTPMIRFNTVVPPTLGTDAFNKGWTLLVPAESLEAYKSAAGYSNYDIRAYVGPHTETIALTTAGTLKDKIESYNMDGVIGLNLSGEINGADFDFMNQLIFLADLDMSGATIVAGAAPVVSDDDDTATSGIVTTPNTLPTNAFGKLNKLSNLTLPSNLVALADSCLASFTWVGDNVLKTVVIPQSVETIGASAFENRLGIEAINLPKNLKKMGQNAFSYCESLQSIEIPGSLDTIPETSFAGCTALKELVINDGVVAIDDRAFMGCKALTSAVIPNSVDSIAGAFQNCINLKEVTLSKNLRTLANYSFAWCTSLEEIELPEGLEYIGQSAFAGDTLLRTVRIPESVTEMRRAAFSMCSNLQSISLPRNLKKVDSDICFKCTSLKTALLLYDLDPETGDKLIPETAPGNERVAVGSDAFQYCESLESVYIGNNVFFLNDKCFGDTPNLKAVYVNNVTPPGMYVGESAFTSFDATLYVPQAAINTYRTNQHWKNFTKILPLEKEGSGVADLFNDVDAETVKVENGRIIISENAGNAQIVDLSGKVVYSGKGGSVEVANGLYIVTVGSTTVKVIVK